jgi:hypothetical protein
MESPERRKDTSISVSVETKEELEKQKLLDGEESWDHLIRRKAGLPPRNEVPA